MYLTFGTRSDIAFTISQLNKHNVDPRKGYLQASKRKVWYLKGIMNLGLIYRWQVVEKLPADLLPYGLINFIDNNFAGDPKDQKSIMRYCFFLNRAVVSWSSKKQQTVSTSTTKTEYIVLGQWAREVVWIKRFINELEIEVTKVITLSSDNEMSITLTMNAESQWCTKHIDVQQHYIRDLIEKEDLIVIWMPGLEMLANRMTKVLPTEMFKRY